MRFLLDMGLARSTAQYLRDFCLPYRNPSTAARSMTSPFL